MKTKHTQGPWEIDGAEIYGAKDKDGSQRLIARIDYDANGKKELSEEDWANARLIASAPELLNALACLLESGEKTNYAFFVKGSKKSLAEAFSGQKELLKNAREAIAKAKGEL